MLEINLVKCQGPFSPVYTLISRERIVANDAGDIIDAAMNFLKANSDTLAAGLADTDLVARIMNAKDVTIDSFMSLKFILAQAGMDVLVHQVAELEVGKDGIADGTNEYNVIDNLTDGIAKIATKVVVPSNSSNLGEVYDKICNLYNFFNTELLKSYKNPLEGQLSQLKRIESAVGVSSNQITTYLNSILEYLGKSIILISND